MPKERLLAKRRRSNLLRLKHDIPLRAFQAFVSSLLSGKRKAWIWATREQGKSIEIPKCRWICCRARIMKAGSRRGWLLACFTSTEYEFSYSVSRSIAEQEKQARNIVSG